MRSIFNKKRSKKESEKKIERSGKTFCSRSYTLNMPQMLWSGMSENWMLKELGDMHWKMITDGLGIPSDALVDSNGERLYASFVRLRWESTSNLLAFKENEIISIEGKLSRYGSKMFFSEDEIISEDKKIQASLMSVFSSRTAEDNTSLKKGTLPNAETANIDRHVTLPTLAKEYLNIKTKLLSDDDNTENISIDLNERFFPIHTEVPIYTQEYTIEPYDDVNGVGLLYFASYPKISDKCERL